MLAVARYFIGFCQRCFVLQYSRGVLAEQLGNGLQNRLERCNSARRLQDVLLRDVLAQYKREWRNW